jgi:hypothetical protein
MVCPQACQGVAVNKPVLDYKTPEPPTPPRPPVDPVIRLLIIFFVTIFFSFVVGLIGFLVLMNDLRQIP